jgi:tetratricopeptide (TPR) repeat protein
MPHSNDRRLISTIQYVTHGLWSDIGNDRKSVPIFSAQSRECKLLSTPERLRRARLNKASKRPIIPPTLEASTRFPRVLVSIWTLIVGLWSGAGSVVSGSLGIIALLIVSAILWHVLAVPSMSISEISIPKSLAELGYTSTEVSSELKGDILGIIEKAHSHKNAPEVVTKFESVDFNIPGVGLSLFTIEDTLRHLVSFTNYWQISGHITDDHGKYVLHLRIWDGLNNKIFEYDAVSRKEVPILMTDAAQAVVGQIDPYIVAASFLQTDSNRAEDLAKKIIENPQSDRLTIAWTHILLSNVYSLRHNYDRALKEDEAALDIDKNMAAAHLAKGVDLLSNDCGSDECIENSINEMKLTLKIDPRNAAAYANIGLAENKKAFRMRSEHVKPNYRDAELDYRRAVALDDQMPMPHLNLGRIFSQEDRLSEAEDELKNYLMIVPNDVFSRELLGTVFQKDNKYDEAAEQYYIVLLVDEFDLDNLDSLCVILRLQGYIDDYRSEKKSIAILRDTRAGAGN